MTLVEYEKHGSVAVLTVNNPPVNAMSPGVPRGICDGMRRANDNPDIAAIVLIGAGRGFIAGADIRYFSLPWPDGEESFYDVINAFEASPRPVIAAIHGHALGGGLEVAMACHYRVIDRSAVVGQPEVKLGFPPGAGGTQRLPRLAGVENALNMIVAGNHVSASDARSFGIVDAVVESTLLDGAMAFAHNIVDTQTSYRRTRDLTVTPPDSALFDRKRKEIVRSARGMRAPYACIECVEAAVHCDFDTGIKREREIFEACVNSDESRALRHVFFAERASTKIPGIDRSTKPRQIDSGGVIGAGTMGGGIAMNFANAGIPVVVVENDQAALDRGMQTIHRNYATSVKRGRLSAEEADRRLALISPSVSMSDLASADYIIEAVFEEMAIKKSVFASLDSIAKPGAILASNTSYLNVDEIGDSIPDRHGHVLGTHFFSPANVMRLLEVVRSRHVSDINLVTTMKLARQMGKLPIIAGVCHGFIGNRMLEGYFGEVSLMIEEGARPDQIDTVMYDFGMAMGPVAVMDLAGLDIGWRKRKDENNGTAPDSRGAWIANRLCEMGRYGQKTGRGYYLYEEGSRTGIPDPEVEALAIEAAEKFGLKRREFSDEEILQRVLYPLVNIGAQILDEGHALRASDIDLVYINGYGFPVWRGGPMHWAGCVGLDEILAGVQRQHAVSHKAYWKPASLLKRLVEDEMSFDEFDKTKS